MTKNNIKKNELSNIQPNKKLLKPYRKIKNIKQNTNTNNIK